MAILDRDRSFPVVAIRRDESLGLSSVARTVWGVPRVYSSEFSFPLKGPK